MARTPRASTPPTAVAAAAPEADWTRWPLKLQALHAHAALGLMGVFGRYAAALTGARDVQGIGQAQRLAVADWAAWAEDVQRDWAELARLVPAQAWSTTGWRLKPLSPAATPDTPVDTVPDAFEQSKLGFEMLLRPWMPAPDLDHTDEFVA